MEPSANWLTLFLGLIFTASAAMAIRLYTLHLMKGGEPAPSEIELHPAELAYLMRPGDSTHCLIVLFIDLLQQKLKDLSGIIQNPPQGQYEQIVWSSVRKYIENWSSQKYEELLPEFKTKNPLKIAAGFWSFQRWIKDSLAPAFAKLIKDPLSIKKYFSPVGLSKALVAIASSGIKEPLSEKLSLELQERGLLVGTVRRKQFSRYLKLLGYAQLIALSIILALTSGLRNWFSFAVLFLIALLNGNILRIVKTLPTLLPLFEELSLVLDSVKGEGIRMVFMRGALKFFRLSFWLLALGFSAIVLAGQSLLFGLISDLHYASWTANFFSILALSLNFLLNAEIFRQAEQISSADQLTISGEKLLKIEHQNIQEVSLLQAFTAALSEPAYNKSLSEIVAIYGIETVFLLA